jgi:tetratricopeptide (TPR) repeat protein
MFGRIFIAITLAVPLFCQPKEGLLNRIRSSPLPPDQRQAVAAFLSAKDYDHIEALMTANVTSAGSAAGAAELEALLGAIEFMGGRMNRAAEAFRRGDSLATLADSDRFTLAMSLVKLGDAKAARTELTRLNEIHPDQSLYLYWLARLDYDQRLYEEAVAKLQLVISRDPTSARAFDNLGLSLDMQGRTDEALSALMKAVDLNRKLSSNSPWPSHNLGYLLFRLQRFHEAEDNLRESLKYDPQFALCHYHLGRTLESLGREEEAIAEYHSAGTLDPMLAEPLYSLGRIYRRHDRLADADNAFAEYKRRKASAERN